MTIYKKCAPGRRQPDRGATDKSGRRGLMSVHSIPQKRAPNKPDALTAILGTLDDLRARFWAACDRGDPEADRLAEEYRAAHRAARQFSPDASRLIDQARQRAERALADYRKHTAILHALERAFVPSPDDQAHAPTAAGDDGDRERAMTAGQLARLERAERRQEELSAWLERTEARLERAELAGLDLGEVLGARYVT